MTIVVGALSNVLYQGLSGDAKPTRSAPSANGVVPKTNDVFFETDTCLWYLFDGDAKWNCTTLTPPLAAKSGGTPPPMA